MGLKTVLVIAYGINALCGAGPHRIEKIEFNSMKECAEAKNTLKINEVCNEMKCVFEQR